MFGFGFGLKKDLMRGMVMLFCSCVVILGLAIVGAFAFMDWLIHALKGW